MKTHGSERFNRKYTPNERRSDRYVRDLIHTFGARSVPGGFEIQTEMPFDLGTGLVSSLDLREGFMVDFFKTRFHADYSNRLFLKNPTIAFTFYLSGMNRISGVSPSIKKTVSFDGKVGGISTVGYFRELNYEYSVKGGERNVLVSVNIAPSIFRSFLGDQPDGLPGVLHDIAEGDNLKEYSHTGPVSPLMSATLHEMLHCPYSGAIRKIFMEGKALELVAHKLAQIQSGNNTSKPTRIGKRDDLERIYEAETLLREDLENPPMLSELAGAVGISYKKLNAGFREVFGATVFGRLRHIRLERARYLMEKQGKNVAEAAFTVGYNSLPSFSNAFSKFFGVSPGRCSRR